MGIVDLEFWERNGYVVVPDAVPGALLDEVIDAIWVFLDMAPDDPSTWYREATDGQPYVRQRKQYGVPGLVELYHHQALWNVRQHPRMHQIFSEIWKTEQLWVSIDRANMNPPVRPGWDPRSVFHWDIDTSLRPVPVEVQGVLYLTDTSEDQGAFRCVPGLHRTLEAWAATQPVDRNPFQADMSALTPKTIAGKAGDLIIWDSRLAHTNERNTTNRPRLGQYLKMFPAKEDDQALRQIRLQSWETREAPNDAKYRENVDSTLERKRYGASSVVLTELGEKLLGLKRWRA
ncbi:MAG: hypothetical protein JWO36_665 [Myxococcales bacterium]|nr:hypothetical protein [Myxococcales bacterium]